MNSVYWAMAIKDKALTNPFRLRNHVIVWSVYIVYACAIAYFKDGETNFLFRALSIILNPLALIYLVFWAFKNASFKGIKKSAFTVGRFIVAFIVYTLSLLLLRFAAIALLQGEKSISEFDAASFLSASFQSFLEGMLPGFVIYLIYRFYLHQKELKMISEEKIQIQLQQQELEKQKLHYEAAFLRAQINPHFLQNVLNFIYAKSLTTNSPVLSDSIITLSEIMRYSMEQPANMDEKTLLENEWRHVENYLHIHEMRFDNKLNIKLDIQDPLLNCTIIPLVLITFVENAFKHGDLRDEQNPLHIQLFVDEERRINFSIKNKIDLNPRKNMSSGLGLENTRQRLQWAYKEDFEMTIVNDKKFFEVKLNVPGGDKLIAEEKYLHEHETN